MDESAAAYKSWTGESPEEKKKASGTAKKTDDKELRERERAYEQYGKQILAMIRSVEDDIEREQISAMDDRNAAVLKRLDMEKRMLLEKAGEVGEAMTGLFEGNVDLLNRVKIPVVDLADAGWEDVGVSLREIKDKEAELAAVREEIASVQTRIADLPDVLEHPEVQAQIDEHYIDRVRQGLTATFTRGDKQYQLQVRKVYPEVREGKFRCDFVFRGARPENIRTGQTYYIDLELGHPEQAVLIPRGTFFQTTGGQWIFVLDKSGSKAYRRNIRIGRQNPQHYEVLEGLEPGERVITSGYEAFKDNEVLVIQ